MTNKKDLSIDDLTNDQKKEISECYRKQFDPLIKQLQQVFSEIIIKKDYIAMFFLIDIFRGLCRHATDQIADNDLDSDYLYGWSKNVH